METVYDLSDLCESVFLDKKILTEAEDDKDKKNDNPFADTKDSDTDKKTEDTEDAEDTEDTEYAEADDSDDGGSDEGSNDSPFGGSTTGDDDSDTVDDDDDGENDDFDSGMEDEIGVGGSVQDEEYSDVMNFGITLIMLAAQVHFWHINCQKGFEHETLQTLYYSLDSNGDKLLENVVSVTKQHVLAGNELSFDFGNLEFDRDESVGILEDMRTEASELASRFEDNQGLCGILGDISEAIGVAIYKLTQFDGE